MPSVNVDKSEWRGPQKGAYRLGRLAAQQGMSKSDCPYRDKRTNYRGSVTFSRSFIKAWHEGFDDAKR